MSSWLGAGSDEVEAAPDSSSGVARGGTRSLSGRVGRADDGNVVLGFGSCRVDGGRVAIGEWFWVFLFFFLLWCFLSLCYFEAEI